MTGLFTELEAVMRELLATATRLEECVPHVRVDSPQNQHGFLL
jgi:hypothetical protein